MRHFIHKFGSIRFLCRLEFRFTLTRSNCNSDRTQAHIHTHTTDRLINNIACNRPLCTKLDQKQSNTLTWCADLRCTASQRSQCEFQLWWSLPYSFTISNSAQNYSRPVEQIDALELNRTEPASSVPRIQRFEAMWNYQRAPAHKQIFCCAKWI